MYEVACVAGVWKRREREKRETRNARGARGGKEGGKRLAFLSRLKLPFPSLSNACNAGYVRADTRGIFAGVRFSGSSGVYWKYGKKHQFIKQTQSHSLKKLVVRLILVRLIQSFALYLKNHLKAFKSPDFDLCRNKGDSFNSQGELYLDIIDGDFSVS